MTIVTCDHASVQPARTADPWARFDEWTWEPCGFPEDSGEYQPPSEEDRRWAAEHHAGSARRRS